MRKITRLAILMGLFMLMIGFPLYLEESTDSTDSYEGLENSNSGENNSSNSGNQNDSNENVVSNNHLLPKTVEAGNNLLLWGDSSTIFQGSNAT
ncbi:hypothetical protein [Enterococcus mundtii]|uniref:hypothetical protein n=1 Tax=Enterococcus mundtii TaxID=53346 RepID=UPI00055140DD|nr:hypothetical protein [Enterococcus mundtii]